MIRRAISFVIGFTIALSLAGCTRESARAQLQADQAIEGAQRLVVGRDVVQVLAALTPEQRAVIQATMRKVLTLLSSARGSLAPGLRILAAGKPIDVATTADQAAANPDAFALAAAEQAGRAHAEADAMASWRNVGAFALDLVGEVHGSWLSQLALLVGTGGLGTAGLIAAAKGFTAARLVPQLRKGLELATAFGDDMERAETATDVKAVKAKHVKIQTDAGVRPLIQSARGRSTHLPPAPL